MQDNKPNRTPKLKPAQQIADEVAKAPLIHTLRDPLLDILSLLANHTEVINQHAKQNVINLNNLQVSLRKEFAHTVGGKDVFDELIKAAEEPIVKPKLKLVTINFMGVPTQAWVPADAVNDNDDTTGIPDSDYLTFIETEACLMYRGKLRRIFVQEIPEDANYH